MTIPASVATLIAGRRDLLDRLERFVQTPEYRHLISVAEPIAEGEVEPWFSEWMIEPVCTLREPPIETVARPGGLALVEQQLIWIAGCLGA